MDEEAREQPRPGDDDETQLLEKREGVQLKPVLGDLSIDEPVELETVERDSRTRRRQLLELTEMGAFEVDALCHEVALPNCVLHGQAQVREAFYDSARNWFSTPRSPVGAGSRLAGAWAT